MDIRRFSQDVTEKKHRLNLSDRELAKELGTTPYYINKAIEGELNDLFTYLALCQWLEIPPDRYVLQWN